MRKGLWQIISGAASLVVFGVLLAVVSHMGVSQDAQTVAERWSKEGGAAQVSCFFSVNAGITKDRLEEFSHSIDTALQEASITQESTNPGARLWADTYSASGKVTLSSSRASLTASAIGVGGDFFLFHPQELLTGSLFSGRDVLTDYVIIDEDAAWQLFGSNDVAGQTVFIGGVPHIVTGVIRRPQGRMEKAAGLGATVVYVSYQTLSTLGTDYGINHYEVVMPNPVKGFALKHVKDKMGVQEQEAEILENTSRYSLLSRLKNIRAFGTRSMNGKAIIYPYWENIARGYEDVLAVLTLMMMLFLAYPVTLGIIWFVRWYRHRGWTWKDAARYVGRSVCSMQTRFRSVKNAAVHKVPEDGT